MSEKLDVSSKFRREDISKSDPELTDTRDLSSCRYNSLLYTRLSSCTYHCSVREGHTCIQQLELKPTCSAWGMHPCCIKRQVGNIDTIIPHNLPLK